MVVDPKQKLSKEDQYRSSVKDALVVLRVLGAFCGSVEDAVGMAELALNNDGQLKMLIAGIEESSK